MTETTKEMMDVRTFLEVYSISRPSFYRHMKNKTIKVVKDGKRVYIRRQDADAFVENLGKN